MAFSDWFDKAKCQATVHVRDVPRYTGRGKGGFEMHYTKKQCSRKALANGYCKQHENRAEGKQ